MSSYFELVKFEYRKILRKRSTVITLILGILLTAISSVGTLLGNYYIDGEVFESNYDSMKKDREYIRGLSGREINSELLSETIEAYSLIPNTSGKYTDTDEYQRYARPYSQIYSMIRRVYQIDDRIKMETISKEDLDDFYMIRQELVERTIENKAMSAKEKSNSINLSRKVKTPFIYSYTGGYTRFVTQMYTMAILICFICTICISPLFAGEYTDGMDGLVFSSKYGKNKLICAKLFTGISITIILNIVFAIISYLIVMMFYGWEGGSSPIQLFSPLSIVPFTMGQLAFLYFVLILFGNILSSVLTMVLSAKLKSPFMVLVIMTAITIFPGFVSVSEDVLWIFHLYNLIPVKMFHLDNIINVFSIDFLGLTIQPYELILSFAMVASITLMPFAYRNFKNHN